MDDEDFKSSSSGSGSGVFDGLDSFFRRWGVLILIGAVVFFLSYFFIGRKKSSAPSSSGVLPGLASQPGANGQPVVEYVPTTGDTYTNVNDTTNNSTTNVTNNPAQPPFIPVPVIPPHPLPVPTPQPSPSPSPAPQPAPAPQPGPTYRQYTIQHGDTLSGIASSIGTTWQNLYHINQSVIDSTAAQHGNPIPGGPWNNIFDNEVIQLPA